jgi:signal transduction histidine kinase
MKVLLFVMLGAAVLIAVAFLLLRKRVETGALLKAAARAEAAARLRTSRGRAELDYVLERLDRELDHVAHPDGPQGARSARLRELRDVLRQSLVCAAETFPLSGPAAEVIDGFRPTAGERELLYSESGDGRWLQVQGDRMLLRWALGELFTNIALHAGDWSRIAVLAEPVDGAILLTVRDDGRGTDSTTTARLYSPYTPRTGSPGPGLGLYAVRTIVERLGGQVEVRSQSGDGLVHKLRLPTPPSGPYGGMRAPTHHAMAKPPQA